MSIEIEPIDMNLPESEIVNLMMEQLGSIGFLLIKNVEDFDEDEMLKFCKEFHNIPLEEKKKLYWKNHNPNNKNIYRGMAPFIDNDVSHKEIFDMGIPLDEISNEFHKYPLYEDTPFPKNYKNLETYYKKQLKSRLKLGFKLASYIAIGLGKEKNYFEPYFENSLSTFRTIYYKPRSQSDVLQNKLSSDELKLTTPEHSDSGFITILSTFHYHGLQILVDGNYKSIKPIKNTLIINLGDFLSKITNNKLKSTKHRVADIGIERYSNPFFFDPNILAKIPSNINNGNSEKLNFGDFLINKMKKSYGEWKDLEI